MLNFSNPEPVSEKEAQEMLELTFDKTSDKTESSDKVDKPDKVEEPELTPNEDNDVVSTGPDYFNLINGLIEKGYFEEAYEGFDEDAEPDEETLTKFIEHNFEKREAKAIEEFFESFDDTTKRIVELDLNTKNKDKREVLTSYLQTLVEENNIKSLDPTNEYDQEKILREWLRNNEGFTQEEIADKISTYKEAGILEKEAKLIKPKLDAAASKIAEQKELEQKAAREYERRLNDDFTNRIVKLLQKGKVGDVPLTKEDATNIYSLLTEDEIEVTIHNNKKVMMSPIEAAIFSHKYSRNGSLETLALASLLLTDREKFEQTYSKIARTKETESFAKEHKYSNALKRGTPPNPAKDKPASKWALPKNFK